MKLGSLFSGGGLGDFGWMTAGFDIRWQVEIDDHCQKILELRYPESVKYKDITILKGEELERVDIITGGFPCQPFSVAGKRKGKDDNRYLWPEMLRVIKECKPRWVVGENVPGIINLALDTVCSDLEAEGYEVWPIVFPSHALGAWHKRDRLWIIAFSSSERCYNGSNHRKERQVLYNKDRNATKDKSEGERRECRTSSFNEDSSPPVENSRCPLRQWGIISGENGMEVEEQNANLPKRSGQTPRKTLADSERIYVQGQYSRSWEREPWGSGWWKSEPNVDRVANGIADRVHRLKCIGNGQVPACTYVIGSTILDIEESLKYET